MKKSKKLNIMTVILCLMAGTLAGCGNRAVQEIETAPETETVQESEVIQEAETVPEIGIVQESEEVPETEIVQDTGTGENILIAYFTWADNTHVEDPSAVNVDASTSASVLAPGNVGLIASWIQEEIGGDLFSIQVEDLYSSDYDECLDRAADEKADNARPALATHVENIDAYETVYIGYPKTEYHFSCVLCA